MTIAELPIKIDREKLAKFCRDRKIRKLSLFGSVLRRDFDPARSDVDMLVEFSPDESLSLLEFIGYQFELGEMVGRRVDLVEPDHLSKYYRNEVLREAIPIYEQA